MRKVLFTEEQIRTIFKEDVGRMDLGKGREPKVGSEVGNSPNGYENPSIEDKISKQRVAHTWGYGVPKRSFMYALHEQNQNLVNKKVTVPDEIISSLPNGKLKQNLMNDPNMSVNTADQNIFRSNDSENAGMKQFNKFLKSQNKNKRNVDKTIKKINKNNGDTNAFLKSAPKKGNGTAHSKKNNNVTFTYEN